MNGRGFATVLVALIIVGLLAVGGFAYYEASKNQTSSQPPSQQTVQMQQNNSTSDAPVQQPANPTTPNTNANSPTPNPTSSSGSNDSSSVEPSPTAVSTTPTSGPIGTTIVLHGTFSTCGYIPAGDGPCTEDRFNGPAFLQNGALVTDDVDVSKGSAGGNGSEYQVPSSLAPGKYEFAMENCLGKGCTYYHLGWFTVTN